MSGLVDIQSELADMPPDFQETGTMLLETANYNYNRVAHVLHTGPLNFLFATMDLCSCNFRTTKLALINLCYIDTFKISVCLTRPFEMECQQNEIPSFNAQYLRPTLPIIHISHMVIHSPISFTYFVHIVLLWENCTYLDIVCTENEISERVNMVHNVWKHWPRSHIYIA